MQSLVVTGSQDFEYVCHECGQLRLWMRGEPFDGCGNCGSMDVTRGAPGTLDKDEVLAAKRR